MKNCITRNTFRLCQEKIPSSCSLLPWLLLFANWKTLFMRIILDLPQAFLINTKLTLYWFFGKTSFAAWPPVSEIICCWLLTQAGYFHLHPGLSVGLVKDGSLASLVRVKCFTNCDLVLFFLWRWLPRISGCWDWFVLMVTFTMVFLLVSCSTSNTDLITLWDIHAVPALLYLVSS